MQLSDNKILITGGASGIGFGLAERFIKEGNTVLICGRRKELLEEASQKLKGIITFPCDLSDASDRVRLFEWIASEHSDLNILINNAGIQNWMTVNAPEFSNRAADEITINCTAPVHLSALFIQLPALKTIINVTSALAFVPLTKVPVYCATKAFMHSFTLSLREQLKGQTEVLEIIPPALNTDLGGKGIHDTFPPVGDFIEAVFRQLKEEKTEITFGFSEAISKIGSEGFISAFNRLNPIS